MPPKLKEVPYLNEGLLEALVQLSLPLQVAFIRQYYKITQADLAKKIKIPQSYLSKLEKSGGDHLLSNYETIAKEIGCRLVLVPRSAKIVPRNK